MQKKCIHCSSREVFKILALPSQKEGGRELDETGKSSPFLNRQLEMVPPFNILMWGSKEVCFTMHNSPFKQENTYF